MPKKSPRKQSKKPAWSERIKLTPEESRQRVGDFAKRKETFIASIRKGKNRNLSA